ncbi:hypothetical protein GCM10027049_18160 [Mucilaginibacter puniceus]
MNFFVFISDRQSINNIADNKSKPITKLVIDCQDNPPDMMDAAFSDAYLPKCTEIASLVNLPTKNIGIICDAFILAIPLARNKGVVGSGSKV